MHPCKASCGEGRNATDRASRQHLADEYQSCLNPPSEVSHVPLAAALKKAPLERGEANFPTVNINARQRAAIPCLGFAATAGCSRLRLLVGERRRDERKPIGRLPGRSRTVVRVPTYLSRRGRSIRIRTGAPGSIGIAVYR